MSEMKANARIDVYTASGKRIVVEGKDIFLDRTAGDITIFDVDGIQVAQFRLDNIEGWVINKGD